MDYAHIVMNPMNWKESNNDEEIRELLSGLIDGKHNTTLENLNNYLRAAGLSEIIFLLVHTPPQ